MSVAAQGQKQMAVITKSNKPRGFEILGMHNVTDPEFIKIMMTTDGGVPDATAKIVLPGAHISRSTRRPTGLVFIVEPHVGAAQLLAHKRDLCGGVSMYDIESIPLNSLEFFLKQIGRTFSTLSEIVADFSLYETRTAFADGDRSSKLIDGLRYGRVLGEENCSISIVRSVDEDQEQHFHIIIKSYDPITVQLLHKSLTDNPHGPITQVLSSPVYKAALLQGNIKRNTIARHLARVLDCRMMNADSCENLANPDGSDNRAVLDSSGALIENVVHTITPTVEQHYNILAKITYQGRPMLAFYDGCFHIGEDRSIGVLLGLGRDVGYQYYWNPENRMIRFGSDEYASAFPMGVPQQPQQQLVIERALATATSVLNRRGITEDTVSTIPASQTTKKQQQQQGITIHTPAHVVWSGPFDLHMKNIAGSYDSAYAKQSRLNLYSLLGVEKLETCKMVTQSCYISSPLEEELSIVDIVKLRSRSLDHVRLRHGCEFMKTQFMSCYYRYRDRFTRQHKVMPAAMPEDALPTLNAIIQREDLHFCYLDPQALESLLEYL